MLLLVPLGGLGTRFKSKGYGMPKPLINVMGKPIIYWLLDNLDLTDISHIIIPYNFELTRYRLEDRLRTSYPDIKFIFKCLTESTGGAGESILLALQSLDIKEDMPILCVDGDSFYTTNIIKQWQGDDSVFVFSDCSEEPIYSYVSQERGIIMNIVEKDKISNLACTGAYGFGSWMRLMDGCKHVVDGNIRQKGEFYTSTIIKHMLTTNNFTVKTIDVSSYICLGTPMHLRIFCNNYPRISAFNSNLLLKPKRYCFDLDNTLVTFPKINGDYTSVEPIDANIRLVRYLKQFGNIIILYTARRMKTHSGNIGKLLADIGKITFDTLEKFDIPYDEIFFGKPHADFYVDDLAISAFSNLEKELGYYRSTIVPREFNQLSNYSMQIYKKMSSDLSGEIYYYKQIPDDIKDLFPMMLNYDMHNTWYEMEMINGIPITKLYLAEELTTSQLLHILGSIERIHQCKSGQDDNTNNINMYENYALKLKTRYESYDYSRFDNSHEMYVKLMAGLKMYEQKNSGTLGIIHGDTVMTNIIINNFGKIKFIDMRGIIGETLTIYGDVMYDYAKLYQSLVGYDEILDCKNISNEYKATMIACFKDKFMEYGYDWNDLLLLTNALIFTLIPLHDNDKCEEYYKLITM